MGGEGVDYAGWSALVIWSTFYTPEGCWSMHLADGEGEESEVRARWDSRSTPPTLLERYDALAALGLAVVEGGAEAWQWTEQYDEESGQSFWIGRTRIRALRFDEWPAIDPLHGTV
jgi:hypothetical protein